MIAVIKNVWSCISTLPYDYVFMTWRLIRCRDKLSPSQLYIHAMVLSVFNMYINISLAECYIHQQVHLFISLRKH